MSESDNIKSYSATDIQKYLRGELSSADMHAMEKAALEDPFLADAMEGMEVTMNEYGEETINTDLAELNTAIAQKSNTGRVIAMRPSAWWMAAAAIVIIFGAVFVYKNFTNTESYQQNAIAKGEKAKPPAQPTIGPADESATSSTPTYRKDSGYDGAYESNLLSKNVDKDYKVTPKTEKFLNERSFASPQLSKDSLTSYYSLSASEPKSTSLPPVQLNFDTVKSPLAGRAAGVDIAKVDDISKKETNNDKETLNRGIVAASKPEARGKQEELRNQTYFNNSFRGRVTDNNNQPIANAVISNEKEKSAAVTDNNGFFNFNGRDTLSNVRVSGMGFESKKVELNSNIVSNEIKLDSDKGALNEVVVTGYGTQKKKTSSRLGVSTKLSTKVQDATPVIPWMEYENYLEKNKKSPDGEINAKKGEVVVSFQVDKKGELSSFKIEQSLGINEDAEAVRLIKEGPAWKLTKGKKARATVIIRF